MTNSESPLKPKQVKKISNSKKTEEIEITIEKDANPKNKSSKKTNVNEDVELFDKENLFFL